MTYQEINWKTRGFGTVIMAENDDSIVEKIEQFDYLFKITKICSNSCEILNKNNTNTMSKELSHTEKQCLG